jgi:hypothetical protein
LVRGQWLQPPSATASSSAAAHLNQCSRSYDAQAWYPSQATGKLHWPALLMCSVRSLPATFVMRKLNHLTGCNKQEGAASRKARARHGLQADQDGHQALLCFADS